MSIGPLNDIVITITNVIRKSAYATDAFNGSDEAEAMFDEWQKQVAPHCRHCIVPRIHFCGHGGIARSAWLWCVLG